MFFFRSQHIINVSSPNYLTQCSLCHISQCSTFRISRGNSSVSITRIIHFEQEIPQIRYTILNDRLDIDDIFITGDHQRFIRNRLSHCKSISTRPESELHTARCSNSYNVSLAYRTRIVPMQTPGCGACVFTKGSKHSLLIGPNGIETRCRPDNRNYYQNCQNQTKRSRAT